MIKAKNISKKFKENILFKDLCFEIKKGDKVCITADSGKGKSTLLHILLGLENLDEGKIFFKEKLLTAENILVIRNYIAWLPQELAIDIEKTDDLIGLMALKKEQVINYMKDLNLERDLLTQNFKSLSGGQKQRLLLACCLSQEKEILILDEPTSALDKTAIDLLIKTLWKKKGLTIVSASHHKDWKAACNEIITL